PRLGGRSVLRPARHGWPRRPGRKRVTHLEPHADRDGEPRLWTGGGRSGRRESHRLRDLPGRAAAVLRRARGALPPRRPELLLLLERVPPGRLQPAPHPSRAATRGLPLAPVIVSV